MTPEGEVKRDIKKFLKEIGAYAFWPVQTGMGAATIDCLVCYEGRFYGIEAKRPNIKGIASGKLTKRQEKILNEIAYAGGSAFVAYSVEDVRQMLLNDRRCLI